MTVKEALYRKFDKVLTRPGRGGNYPYIPWQDIADRMNEVFGINWSSMVESQEVIGANIIVRVRVTVTDPETGRVQVQEGFGGAPNDDRQDAGNPFKAAYSKALKDACKKWGVGLYLEEDGETETSNFPQSGVPSGYMGKEMGVPPNKEMPSNTVTNQPAMGSPSATGGMALPEGVSMPKQTVQTSTTVTQQKEFTPTMPVPGMEPKISEGVQPNFPPAMPNQNGTTTMATPTSKVTPINTGDAEYISDVQKAALNSILNFKQGLSYEELAKEAFEANGIIKDQIPEPDNLTYQEAVVVVKYGNDKFRKR